MLEPLRNTDRDPYRRVGIYLERRFRVFFFFIWLEIFETCNLLQLKKKCVFCIAILENFWFLEKFVKL